MENKDTPIGKKVIIIESIMTILLFTCVCVIIFFNIIAISNYGKSIELNIVNTGQKCAYSNLNSTNEDYIIKNNLKFSLGKQQTVFTQICSSLCRPDIGGKTCIPGQENSNNVFKDCLDLLKPDPNCTDVSIPLAQDKEGNYLYAQKIIFH